MAGIAAGFAFAPAVSRHLPYRSATSTTYASVPSSSFSVSPVPWSRAARRGRPKRGLVAVARYSSYGSDEDDDEDGGGGRNRAPEPEQDPALDIDRIQSSTVRLLDAKKDMVGVIPVSEAVRIADENDLILAILSLDGDPPVLRLFEEKEYKKHKYEQQKKKRVQQKRSVAKRMGIKELKMGYNIDIHDYSVRLRAAKKFLKAGDKAKIVVNLKGRENLYKKQAIELLRRFQTDVGELATEGSKNFAERNIYVILVPNKLAIQKEQDGLNKKVRAEGEVDQSEDESDADEAVIEQVEETSLDGDEPVIEELEESKEPETEVSANV
ncbi:translation initiation factor IF3-4, chloroplastic-like [Lolium rigidum]|uniref:translation initiation factor IF3-4, chloroplastic-like n=1 Tax=Lolium rigidum TaxID=89674 RepID=UPI001F5C3575|nr:translation initiation factor IF3-4, chloroplastic-like [Lolium rigidum]